MGKKKEKLIFISKIKSVNMRNFILLRVWLLLKHQC